VDSDKVVVSNGMKAEDAATASSHPWSVQGDGLLDAEILSKVRILDAQQNTICPLCLEELSGQEFFNRMEQAEGRDVPDFDRHAGKPVSHSGN